jgi:hypothetical protein
MRAKSIQATLVTLAVALALPVAAQQKAPPPVRCGEGQVAVKGNCTPACPLTGTIAKPDDCACPAGYGMILLGNGGGSCKRLACAVGKPVDGKLCDCPTGYQKQTASKGKINCVLEKPKA